MRLIKKGFNVIFNYNISVEKVTLSFKSKFYVSCVILFGWKVDMLHFCNRLSGFVF